MVFVLCWAGSVAFVLARAVGRRRRCRGSSSYVSSEPALKAAREADAALPEGLVEACLSTGRTPTAGEVKMIYSTKVIVRWILVALRCCWMAVP